MVNRGLKSAYTPCILLEKGVEKHKLERIINLPKNEFTKVFYFVFKFILE